MKFSELFDLPTLRKARVMLDKGKRSQVNSQAGLLKQHIEKELGAGRHPIIYKEKLLPENQKNLEGKGYKVEKVNDGEFKIIIPDA